MPQALLHTPIDELTQARPALKKGLKKLCINQVCDLLFYFPYKYLDFTRFSLIKDVAAGATVTVRGTIKSIASRYSFRGRMSLCEAIISDTTGSLKVVWFNQPYLAKTLKPGEEVLLAGPVTSYKTLQLQNPIYEKVSAEAIHTNRIVPVYHITAGLFNRSLRALIKELLPLCDTVDDLIPSYIRQKYGLLNLAQALKTVHFPESGETLGKARFRLAFEEIFIQLLAVARHKQRLAKLPAPKISADINLIKNFLPTLPFQLTLSQKKALWQIVQDMENKHPMNRLLQGEVGSGKTLVALIAAIEAAGAGYQVAVLAPTEILAKQHFETFRRFLLPYLSPTANATHYNTGVYYSKTKLSAKLSLGLFTNHFQILDNAHVSRPSLKKALAQGQIKIIIGTHALLENLKMARLGLVVIDEQHRFGVDQRGQLLKTENQKNALVPHLLSMTATPIPRTLALSVYGDLEISSLTELPKGRKRVVTKIVEENNRGQAYNFIKKQLQSKRQAFIITPLVEESQTLDVKSVKREFARLSREIFKGFRLGLLYGGLGGAAKEKVMENFSKGELDILVATSVVEIGIDIANATVMVIEGAERFGLAQLHQFRGRVGRGEHQSYCLLFPSVSNEKIRQRLQALAEVHDGFKLAELDLKHRGFGDLFGAEQSGFKFSQSLTLKTLQLAKEAAAELTQNDPDLSGHPELLAKTRPLLSQIHLE